MRWAFLLAQLILCLIASMSAFAAAGQVLRLRSSTAVAPQLVTGSLSISATPTAINFALVPNGQATASSAISIVTTANLTAVSSVSLYGYFSSASALTTAAGDVLPSSAVFGQCPTGSATSYAAFTQTNPFTGTNGLLLLRSTSLVSLSGSRTDSLFLRVDLSGLPQLPAGLYTGSLVLQAQAF